LTVGSRTRGTQRGYGRPAVRIRADRERVEIPRLGGVLERVSGPSVVHFQDQRDPRSSPSSDGDDLHEIIETDEVCGVTRVQAGAVGVSGCSDQQVERTRPGVTSDVSHGDRKTPEFLVALPVRVGWPVEQVGNGVPGLPTLRRHWVKSSSEPPSDSDVDLLAGLDASDQF